MTVGLALAFLFALGWVPLYLWRVETVSDALPAYAASERLWVRATHVVLTVHSTAACIAVSLATDVPVWSAGVSVGLFVAALGFWLWGRTSIAPLRERRAPDQPPLQLRRDGAFGVVRHPLYLSYLIAAGAPLIVAWWAALGVSFALCCLTLAVRVAQEERRLHAQVGPAYAAYCREVKRLIPLLW